MHVIACQWTKNLRNTLSSWTMISFILHTFNTFEGIIVTFYYCKSIRVCKSFRGEKRRKWKDIRAFKKPCFMVILIEKKNKPSSCSHSPRRRMKETPPAEYWHRFAKSSSTFYNSKLLTVFFFLPVTFY